MAWVWLAKWLDRVGPRLVGRLCQTKLDGAHRRLRAIAHVEFLENPGYVVFYRADSQTELRGDFPIRPSYRQQRQDLAFALGQLLGPYGVSHTLQLVRMIFDKPRHELLQSCLLLEQSRLLNEHVLV